MKTKKGFALIATVFVLLVMALMVITTSTFISTDAMVAVKNYNSLDAFYIASAGMEYYLKELNEDNDWSSPPPQKSGSFSGGSFCIATSNEAQDQIDLTVTGLVTVAARTFKRVLSTSLARSGGGAGGYAEYAVYCSGGSGTGYFNDRVTINGSIYADNSLDLSNDVTVNGDVVSSGNITGDTSQVTGTVSPYTEPPAGNVTLDTTYYDSELAIAATQPNKNKVWGNQTLSGTYYVNGSVTMTGPMIVADNTKVVSIRTMNINGEIAFGDNVMFICDNNINMSGAITIGREGTFYSSTGLMPQAGPDVGISNEAGGGVSFLSPGFIYLNGCDLNGYFHAEGELTAMNMCNIRGNFIGGDLVRISNLTTVTHDPALNLYGEIEGINVESSGGSLEVQDWNEIY